MNELQLIIEDGYCRTSGLEQQSDKRNLSIRLEPIHLTAAAIYLLQQAGKRQIAGMKYSKESLFRYRSGAHLSQFLFRAGPWETLELVDLVLEDGRVTCGQNARAALVYFTQGCPHWDMGYGWPPKPKLQDGSPELIPGQASRFQVEEQLGKPTRGKSRWLFDAEEQPIFIDTKWQDDTLVSISSNSLVVQDLILTPALTADLLDTQRRADLQRTFIAPPDKSLVRIEEVRVFRHPTASGQSLVLLSEFDAEENHRISTLSWQPQHPSRVLDELRSSFGRALMTGFCPVAGTPAPLSPEALRLRAYMEASVQMVRQLVLAFKRPEWATEVLSGLSLVVGAYLMGNGLPHSSVLQELELPPQIFLDAFEHLDDYLARPETRVRFQVEADLAGVSFEELAAFQWLLYNLTQGDLSPEDQNLARDLAQVFQQYRKSLQGLG